jgi:hypothetical protein
VNDPYSDESPERGGSFAYVGYNPGTQRPVYFTETEASGYAFSVPVRITCRACGQVSAETDDLGDALAQCRSHEYRHSVRGL